MAIAGCIRKTSTTAIVTTIDKVVLVSIAVTLEIDRRVGCNWMCVKPLGLNSIVGVVVVSMVQRLASCSTKQAKNSRRN